MSFYRETAIKSVRKQRGCLGCGRPIEIGCSAVDCAGHYEGDFWAGSYHSDCREAEVALNGLHNCCAPDEWINLSCDMEWEDWPWLIETFPAVAERMGITTERHSEIADRHAKMWGRP